MNIEYQNKRPSFENVDYYIDLGEHIAYYRRKANISQTELARQLNITRSYLSRVESMNHTQTISFELFFNICRILDVEPKYFFEPLPSANKN